MFCTLSVYLRLGWDTTVTGAIANTHTQALSLVLQSLGQWPTHTHRLCPSYYSHWGNGQHTHTGFVPRTTVTGAMANTHTQALSLVQQSLGQWPTQTHRLCPSYYSHWGNGQHTHTGFVPRTTVTGAMANTYTHLCPSYNSHWGNGQHSGRLSRTETSSH